MSEMASTVVLFDKEKREMDRLRAEVKAQRGELEEARRESEAQGRRQRQAAAMAPEELAGIGRQYDELEEAMVEVRETIRQTDSSPLDLLFLLF